MSVRYRCSCGRTLNAHDEHILRQLSLHLQAEFPAILTHSSAISRHAADLMRSLLQNSVGPKLFVKVFRELHMLRHDRLEMQYLSAVKYNMDRRRMDDQSNLEAFFGSATVGSSEIPKPFSDFDDKLGYAGWVPTTTYLRTVYTALLDEFRPLIDKELMVIDGKVLKGDHSFKLVKRIARVKGTSVFQAMYTMCNEYEQIRMMMFVPSKGHLHLRMPLQELRKAYDLYGHSQPEFVFTDDVNCDRRLLEEELLSLQHNVLHTGVSPYEELPCLEIPDSVRIVAIRRREAMDDALHYLMEEASRSRISVAFNCIWSRDDPSKVSTIQIAHAQNVYILQLGVHEVLPVILSCFLASNAIIKVGRKLGAQFAKINRTYGIHCTGSLEIGTFCRERGYLSNESQTLLDICARVLGSRLVFERLAALSNTVPINLNHEQAKNAALAPWAMLMVHQCIKDLPVLGRRIFGVPEVGAHIAWHPVNRDRPAAYGTIQRISSDTSTQLPSRRGKWVVISVSQILIPGQVLPLIDMALQDFQSVPFEITVSQSELRTWRPVELSPLLDEAAVAPDNRTLLYDLSINNVDHPDEASSDSDSESDSESEHGFTNQAHGGNGHSLASSSSVTSSNVDLTSDEDALSSSPLKTRVLKDIFHVMDMVKVSKRHGAAKEFSRKLRDSLFICDEEDRANIEAHLLSQGQSWESMLKSKPWWIYRRVRRIVPSPEKLLPVVKDLFHTYGPLTCAKTGRTLFDDNTVKIAERVLKAIEAGHVSDPPGISFYFKMGQDRFGLPLYRCSRGTNSVEGGIHQNVIRKFGSFGASPHLADCALADYRLRHNIDVRIFCNMN